MRRTEYLALVDELNKYCYQYYVLSDPEITDEAYDEKYNQLKKLEEAYPQLIVGYSPTQRIGSPVESNIPKRSRDIKMMSLDNVFTEDEFKEFTTSFLNNDEDVFAVELKLDGASLELEYVYGHLTTALTRGDGKTGEVVTHAAKAIRSVPLYIHSLSEIDRIEIRGEVLMPYSVAEEYKKEHPEKEVISPRNIASGSLRLLDPKVVSERKLVFIPHSLGYYPDNFFTDFVGFNRWCKSAGFMMITTQLCKTPTQVIELYNKFVSYRSKLPFAADGLVIKLNNFSRHSLYGETSKFPKWSIAWKFPAEEKQTILKAVEWQIGRTGVCSPVANFTPVELSGAMVSKATLHNMNEITRKDIRIGDTIVVSRSGDVIPKVIKSLPELRTHYSSLIKPPDNCPECGESLIKEKTYIVCKNYGCKAKIIGRMIHFASRGAMDISGLGEAMAEYLYTTEGVHDLSGIMNLTLTDPKSKGLLFDNLLNAIEASKHTVDQAKLLYALGIFGVGEVQAEQIVNFLANKYADIYLLFNTSSIVDSLIEIDGFGEATVNNIRNFINNKHLLFDALNVLDSIKSWKEVKRKTSNILADKIFVITGNLSKPRKMVEDLIKDYGGKVTSSVSKKTTYLVVGSDPGNEKLSGAKKCNTPILNEAELFKLLPD